MLNNSIRCLRSSILRKSRFSILKSKKSLYVPSLFLVSKFDLDNTNIFERFTSYLYKIKSKVFNSENDEEGDGKNPIDDEVDDKNNDNSNKNENNEVKKEKIAGDIVEGLPFYTIDDVQSHNTVDKGIWVIYKNGVYDITQFINEHPGGKERIILAAGHSIEPFWKMYQQHSTKEVLEILETLRIGNISDEEKSKTFIDLNDPYANDPERHPALIPRSLKPYNAEIPPELINDSFITPNDLFFVRNHLPVPTIDPQTFRLTLSIDGNEKSFDFTLDDLKSLPKTTVMSTIQCAGNRRSDLHKVKPVRGLFWDIGAISNAEWSGVKLVDLLNHIGINSEVDLKELNHVIFEGLDCDQEKCYAASIPIEKAIAPKGDVLLAYEMNGEEIPRDHGFPLRAVAPGIVGARNVKWLSKIHFSKEECKGHWQQNDYKGFSPNVDWDNVDFSKSPSIQELPVQSAITEPSNNFVINDDTDELKVKGYAWSGGGRGIVRVDVSIDGGKEWHTADLKQADQPYGRRWAWSLWEVDIPITEKIKMNQNELDIRCKAVDDSYNVQPETTDPIWNLRGVLSNAWHQVKVPINKEKNEE